MRQARVEEEVLDGVMALGRACNMMREFQVCATCYNRAKTGYVRLLGEDSAKAMDTALALAATTGPSLDV